MGAKRIKKDKIITHLKIGDKHYGKVRRIKGLRADEYINRYGQIKRGK